MDDKSRKAFIAQADRAIISGRKITSGKFDGDTQDLLSILVICSQEIHDHLSIFFADRSDIRAHAVAIRNAIKRTENDENDLVSVHSVFDESSPLGLPKFDRFGENLTPDQMYDWGALFGAAALLTIERAVEFVRQGRPYRAAALMLELQELIFDMKFALANPRRLSAHIARSARHDRYKQDLLWLWNHFLASPEYKKHGAVGYKDGVEKMLKKMGETYPSKRLPAASVVERHFREKLSEKDGVQFKRGRPPIVASKKQPLRAADQFNSPLRVAA